MAEPPNAGVTRGALMVMLGLVLEAIVPFEPSLTVRVPVPDTLNMTLNVPVPALNGAPAGRAQDDPVEVNCTVSLAMFTGFQLASTALTVTLKGVAAVCVDGVPVLPVPVPGAAVSPGTRICSLTNVPATMVSNWVAELRVEGEVLAAVSVGVPTFVSV